MITLYLATHKVTGMKYFGKSEVYHTQEDLQKYYHGSGLYWKRHLKVHGDDVKMEVFYSSESLSLIKSLALMYSKFWNIVDSKDYANLVVEDSTRGNPKGFIFPEDAKLRVSNSLKDIFVGDLNPFFGKTHTRATRDKISLSRCNKTNGDKHWLYGKSHKEDTKQKMSANHADFNGYKNPMFNMVSVRDLITGENKRVSKDFFYANKFNSKTKEGYLVGNASKIKNFKKV